MVNTKMLVGLGFLGVAVYAYSQLEMPTTTNGDLRPNGGGLYVPPNGNGDDDIYGPDCSSMWDASGNRINDGWVSHGEISFGPDERRTCSFNGFDVKVYSDKLVYYPSKWFGPKLLNDPKNSHLTKDLCLETWHEIKIID